MPLTLPTKGKLLVAEPNILGDASFNRTVILLAEHNTRSTIGFVLNRPSEFMLSELIEDADCGDIPVYYGGPVETGNLYFIHKVPHLITSSIEICDGMFWGGNFEDVLDLIESGNITKHDIQFFLGYSGWGPQQLDSELEAHSWQVLENNKHENIIGTCSTTLWKEKLSEMGDKYMIWLNAPANPSHN